MRILIASEGTTLKSRVARKFSRATFVLEVNVESRSVHSAVNAVLTPKPRLLRGATERGVNTLIVGQMSAHARASAALHGVRVALAPGLPADEALERFLDGSLTTLENSAAGPLRKGEEGIRPQSRWERRRHVGEILPLSRHGDCTPRGRHHLQQLAGRGH